MLSKIILTAVLTLTLACDDGSNACRDVSGMAPEDWVSQSELAEATNAGFRGCLVDLRVIIEAFNRCGAETYPHQPIAVILDTCADQPAEFQANGRAACLGVWASGTCTEIAEDTTGCALPFSKPAPSCF